VILELLEASPFKLTDGAPEIWLADQLRRKVMHIARDSFDTWVFVDLSYQ
jgi:hypothetical protein